MSKGFSTLDSPGHEGATNTWLTPLSITETLGKFDLDPCGYAGHATADQLIVLPDDGLSANWHGRVWLNPPYGRDIDKWLEKLAKHGNGIALVFSRTDTKWFHKLEPDGFYFLEGRIKFLKPDFTIGTNAGHGSMLVAYGVNNVEAIMQSNLDGMWLLKP